MAPAASESPRADRYIGALRGEVPEWPNGAPC
jgi:hypothetical protein